MLQVPLPNGYNAIIDDENSWLLDLKRWQLVKAPHTFYARIGNYFMHNLVMGSLLVDHINGNGLDNRLENLRVATKQQNRFNSNAPKIEKTSQYKGVHLKRGKWIASIGYNYKTITIGAFDTEIEAALAYDSRARELFGSYARPNFSSLTQLTL